MPLNKGTKPNKILPISLPLSLSLSDDNFGNIPQLNENVFCYLPSTEIPEQKLLVHLF